MPSGLSNTADTAQQAAHSSSTGSSIRSSGGIGTVVNLHLVTTGVSIQLPAAEDVPALLSHGKHVGSSANSTY